jgi:mRNA degradation ribonuclease J1/J2
MESSYRMAIPVWPSSLVHLSGRDERVHSSGHAIQPDLLGIVGTTGPRILISVHTKDPGYFLAQLAGRARGLKCRYLSAARRCL